MIARGQRRENNSLQASDSVRSLPKQATTFVLTEYPSATSVFQGLCKSLLEADDTEGFVRVTAEVEAAEMFVKTGVEKDLITNGVVFADSIGREVRIS